MASSFDVHHSKPHNAEPSAELAKKLVFYQRLIWFFYALFAICLVFFAGGLYWHNAMAIAGGFVAAMMLGMAYLGVVIARDDEIQTVKDRIHHTSAEKQQNSE